MEQPVSLYVDFSSLYLDIKLKAFSACVSVLDNCSFRLCLPSHVNDVTQLLFYTFMHCLYYCDH